MNNTVRSKNELMNSKYNENTNKFKDMQTNKYIHDNIDKTGKMRIKTYFKNG